MKRSTRDILQSIGGEDAVEQGVWIINQVLRHMEVMRIHMPDAEDRRDAAKALKALHNRLKGLNPLARQWLDERLREEQKPSPEPSKGMTRSQWKKAREAWRTDTIGIERLTELCILERPDYRKQREFEVEAGTVYLDTDKELGRWAVEFAEYHNIEVSDSAGSPFVQVLAALVEECGLEGDELEPIEKARSLARHLLRK